LTAGRHDDDVLLVEDGVAFAWKGRALRGSASVDSRMDLWRLLAHAHTCIDLAPGRHFARECVEAMRFGTPVIVPAGSGVATLHATAGGGGKTFADPSELLEAAISFADESRRTAASDDARAYAEANHGSPTEFAASLRDVMTGAGD
jgi:glycosyltransferase involved in cell wall biosynthesis